jgi:tetratricopeptide (TPR) repeat protein
VGLARWFLKAERREQALELMRRAVAMGLPDDLLFRTLWDTAMLERKLGNEPAALAILTDLALGRNPYRVTALEALAKYYEHRERNYAMALEMIRSARALADSEEFRRRQARLERRLAKPRAGRLL